MLKCVNLRAHQLDQTWFDVEVQLYPCHNPKSYLFLDCQPQY